MKQSTRLGVGTLALATAALIAAPAAASASTPAQPQHRPTDVVFVQNDDVSGNQIIAYDRAADGTLTQVGVYPTGGLGGALDGSVVDHLASQGSLTYDKASHTLYAVNAGSDTISVFAVDGDRLSRTQIVSSGGSFPVSVTTHGNLVYVLDALDGGAVQGYARVGHRLRLVPGWNRQLGLDEGTPQFTNTPGQVAFSPNGRHLLVTTKAAANSIEVFRIGALGRPTTQPVVNDEASTVPFALTFDAPGQVVVAEAGTNALESFSLNRAGVLRPLATDPTGQSATCWIVGTGSDLYASNAGSGTLSGYQQEGQGALQSLGTTSTDAGTVDATVSSDGQFLYVQTGADGIVDEFSIGSDGSLAEVGSVTVPNAVGGEGIVAL